MIKKLMVLFQLLTPKQKRKLLLLQGLVILMAFAEIVGILAIGPFMAIVGDVSRLSGQGFFAELYILTGASSPDEFLKWAGLFVLLILLLATIISTYTMWKLSVYGAVVGAELSQALFSHYMNQTWLFHTENTSSELTNKISQECLRITNMVIRPALQMNAKIILVSFVLLGVLVYNPIVAISGAFIFAGTYLGLYVLVRRKLTRNGENISDSQNIRFKLLNEGFGGVKDILLLSRQEHLINQFNKASSDFAVAQGSNQALSQVPRYAMELIAFGSIIMLVLYLLAQHSGDLGNVLPILSVYAMAGFKLLPAMQQIYMSASQIKGNISAFEKIEPDLREARKSVSINDQKTFDNSVKFIIKKEISLNDVSFRYPGTTKFTLNKLSLSVPLNKTIGLVGSSGAGKSTAIDILLGLIKPEFGALEVDGVEINKDNVASFQSAIGFVPQSIFLSEGTIRENIAFGLPFQKVDENRVDQAVKLAHLEDLVSKLEHGLDTNVGERGVQLSGGQKQRIGIARALYHDASVLVFDEATSALDGITEKQIMDAINEFSGKKTIVMIAHRLATVKNCDLIYVLENGKVVDQGTYSSLAEKNSLFKAMVESS